MIVGMKGVALMGRSGAGKTEVAKHLAATYGFERCSTGPICREIATILFGTATKANMHSVSDALIELDPSIFLKAALRRVADGSRVVIDALRYNSDFELAQRRGFTIIRVEASEERRRQFLHQRGEAFDFATDGVHQTEIELDEAAAEILIVNNGSLQDLKSAVETAGPWR